MSAPPARHTVTPRTVLIGGGVTAVALALLLLLGFLPRRSQTRTLADRAHAVARSDSIPEVNVMRVGRSQPTTELGFPGTIQAVHEAAIYARSTGYVRRWFADIGTHVHAGQLLAVIDAPDLDQQLSQAEAASRQATATLEFAHMDLERWAVLVRDSAVTREEYDQKRSIYGADSASLAAADANVRRLEQLKAYERLTAPFDGVVIARNIDDGVFVSPSGGTNNELTAGMGTGVAGGAAGVSSLYRIAQTDTVRVYIGVPQAYAGTIHPGQVTDVTVQERPGRPYLGRVTRSAEAIDASTRTLLTEVDILNTDRSLLPGMYAQVHFHFTRGTPPLELPANALIFRAAGPQVAVVTRDTTVRLHPLDIVRDYGPTLEVASGVSEGDLVVVNPSDDIHDGSRVRLRASPAIGTAPGDERPATPLPPPSGQRGGGVPRTQSKGGS
jgi:membrane fusion protein, multidrug efflux system